LETPVPNETLVEEAVVLAQEKDQVLLVMALEGELVGEELSRYDLSAEEIEVEGKAYRVGMAMPETYLCAAGLVTVNRHLYQLTHAAGKSICPLELRVGIVGGYFTPRAARQGAFVMAHLMAGESEGLFGEVGNMQPSRSSLDRLPKELSPHWEEHRVGWEITLRQMETIPNTAKTLALSVDEVMALMRGLKLQEKQPKQSSRGSMLVDRPDTGGRLWNGDLVRPGSQTAANHPLWTHARAEKGNSPTAIGNGSQEYTGTLPHITEGAFGRWCPS